MSNQKSGSFNIIRFIQRPDKYKVICSNWHKITYYSVLCAAFFLKNYRKKYHEEIANLKKIGHFYNFPSHIDEPKQYEVLNDETLSLPYLMHKGKRLYFPANYSKEKITELYYGYLNHESILGIAVPGEKRAHRYQSSNFRINKDDVFVDLGCAEALFSLDVIETVEKVYLIENNPNWLDALKATFAPYKNKVIFVNKLITNYDSDTTITLETLLKNEIEKPLFVKMDIEGFETTVVKDSLSFIQSAPNLTIACCAYHRNNDAAELQSLFQSIGYKTEFSEGYMLFGLYDIPKFPYFRRGVLRAKRKK